MKQNKEPQISKPVWVYGRVNYLSQSAQKVLHPENCLSLVQTFPPIVLCVVYIFYVLGESPKAENAIIQTPVFEGQEARLPVIEWDNYS